MTYDEEKRTISQGNAEKYAMAVQEYEYKRKHLYILPHDGLGFISYIKSFELSIKIVIIMLVVIVGVCALMGAMFAIVKILFICNWIMFASFICGVVAVSEGNVFGVITFAAIITACVMLKKK